jgi:uncharacterized protein (DUF427 family)
MTEAVQSVNGRQEDESPEPAERIEPSRRWVRVEFNDHFVADSKRPVLVWPREGHAVAYYFPWEDVDQEALTPGRQGSQGEQYYDLHVGDKKAESAAWSYPRADKLSGYVTFKWKAMDHWYEEEEEIFAHPRDPYHRVDAIPSSRHVEVFVDGIQVADTRRPVLVFETSLPVRYYIPQEDIRMRLLEPTRATSRCPYKGLASYWSVTAAGETRRNLVWGYMDPLPEMPRIKGLLSFYNEKVDIYVDGELEQRPETAWS